MTIYEQADRGCVCRREECTSRFTYSWMLSRAYATRGEMERWGWKWIKGAGCRGVFVTNDPAAVDRARGVLRLDAPLTNGTHAAIGAPMHDVFSARRRIVKAYAEMGLDAAIEIDGFDAMTADQLSDELTYFADYQG